MNLQDLVECVLVTDPSIDQGDYTVLFSGSKSGALNAGILLFTTTPLPKTIIERIEYRLVSILMLLVDIERQATNPDGQQDFQVRLGADFKAKADQSTRELIAALETRGIHNGLAKELVMGQQRTV